MDLGSYFGPIAAAIWLWVFFADKLERIANALEIIAKSSRK